MVIPRRLLEFSAYLTDAPLKRVMNLAFPKAHRVPASLLKLAKYTLVSLYVTTEFLLPIRPVGVWYRDIAFGTAMPKAAMDKNS
jgi:hypothetical protein